MPRLTVSRQECHHLSACASLPALLFLPLFFPWQNPDKLRKAQEEVDRVLAGGKSHPSFDDTRELKYITRCINESMRLYPHPPVRP